MTHHTGVKLNKSNLFILAIEENNKLRSEIANLQKEIGSITSAIAYTGESIAHKRTSLAKSRQILQSINKQTKKDSETRLK